MKNIKALGLFILILTLSFGSVLWFASKELATDHANRITAMELAEWDLQRNALNLYLAQAKVFGEAKVREIGIKMDYYFKGDTDTIANALDTYTEPDNIIRQFVTEAMVDSYFAGIVSDNTDGFVVRGYVVSVDTSANCASFGESRSFQNEMLMHANPDLALEAFTRIARGDVENFDKGAIDRPIFFQFVTHPEGIKMQGENTPLDQKGKLAIELTSYDMSGLRNYFMKTKSWESTFRSFEFVTPTYVYNKADLANRPYTENGYHTQIPRLSVNIVFNFKTVIDHNPILKRDLAKFQLLKGETTRDYIIQERILFLVIILLTIVCFMAMRYTHKILSEE